MNRFWRNHSYLTLLFLSMLPVLGTSVETASQVDTLKVKSTLVAISTEVFIDNKSTQEVHSQLLCELDREQKCVGDLIVVLNYGATAKTSISAKSIRLSFDSAETKSLYFDTTFPSIPCALKTEPPQRFRDFLTMKIASESSGMGRHNDNRMPQLLKLELTGITRK